MTDPQESLYQTQLQDKIQLTTEEFRQFQAPFLSVYASPSSSYRMRAEFKAWQQDQQVSYAMYKMGEYKKPYTIDRYEPGSETIQRLMPELIKRLNSDELLRKKLFQIEFLTSTTGEAVITLIYHKPLDKIWEARATELHKQLNTSIIGRSRKQKLVIGNDFVYEQMTVNEIVFKYQQVENSFTQPNAFICENMLEWAVEQCQNTSGDLLELYCGNGNFTLPLSQKFNKVLATEISKPSIKSAQLNCQLNTVSNIAFVRMSSEEFTQALNKERPFRRLESIDLDSYNFSTVLVDPPRAGLDEKTLQLVQRFDNIIYISCNPNTLAQNLETLTDTHTIARIALFDQFPFTPHRELGVALKKR